MSADQPNRRALVIPLLLGMVWPVLAQTRAQPKRKADADRLGMTCAEILKMSSTEWIAYFSDNTKADLSSATVRAAAVYGPCYQARTDDLARALVRSGKGPPTARRTDFAAFEAALKNFTAKALVDADPPADSTKQALAALYQDQFRYQFYQEYEVGNGKQPNTRQTQLPAEKEAAPSRSSPTAPTAPEDTDQMTRAKNRFGELLGGLPDDKLHELHGAFGEVLGLHPLDEPMRLAVYRYAIFLLEPSTGPSSYPPPF